MSDYAKEWKHRDNIGEHYAPFHTILLVTIHCGTGDFRTKDPCHSHLIRQMFFKKILKK